MTFLIISILFVFELSAKVYITIMVASLSLSFVKVRTNIARTRKELLMLFERQTLVRP